MLVTKLGAAMPRIPQSPKPHRRLVGPSFAGEPKSGHYLVVQGLGPTAEEVEEVMETAADIGTISAAHLADAILKVAQSVVIVSKGGRRSQGIADGMSP